MPSSDGKPAPVKGSEAPRGAAAAVTAILILALLLLLFQAFWVLRRIGIL